MKISYSFGIIDLLHIGHINVLREAKSHADLHIFGLVEDEAAREWMGTLLSNCEERKKVLEQIACVDEIVSQKTFDPTENLRRLHERYPEAEITLYHGNNWGVLPAEEYLRSIGGRVVLAQYYHKFSPKKYPPSAGSGVPEPPPPFQQPHLHQGGYPLGSPEATDSLPHRADSGGDCRRVYPRSGNSPPKDRESIRRTKDRGAKLRLQRGQPAKLQRRTL